MAQSSTYDITMADGTVIKNVPTTYDRNQVIQMYRVQQARKHAGTIGPAMPLIKSGDTPQQMVKRLYKWIPPAAGIAASLALGPEAGLLESSLYTGLAGAGGKIAETAAEGNLGSQPIGVTAMQAAKSGLTQGLNELGGRAVAGPLLSRILRVSGVPEGEVAGETIPGKDISELARKSGMRISRPELTKSTIGLDFQGLSEMGLMGHKVGTIAKTKTEDAAKAFADQVADTLAEQSTPVKSGAVVHDALWKANQAFKQKASDLWENKLKVLGRDAPANFRPLIEEAEKEYNAPPLVMNKPVVMSKGIKQLNIGLSYEAPLPEPPKVPALVGAIMNLKPEGTFADALAIKTYLDRFMPEIGEESADPGSERIAKRFEKKLFEIMTQSANDSGQFKPINEGENVQGKTFYHGTKAKVGSVADLDPSTYGKPNAIAGLGLYTTDNPEVAKGYAGKSGTVLSTPLPKLNFLSLDKPIPAKLAANLGKIEIGGEPMGVQDGETGLDFIKRLHDAMQDEGYSTGDATEVMQDVSIAMRDAGYDAAHMIGGGRVKAGSPKHNVMVMLPDYLTGKTPLADSTPAVPGAAGVSATITTPGESLKDVWPHARAFYSEGKDAYENQLVKKLMARKPEAIANSIKPGDVTNVEMVKRALLGHGNDKAAWNTFRRQYIQSNLLGSPDMPWTGDVFKLKEKMNAAGNDQLRAIFGTDDEGKRVLHNLSVLAEATSRVQPIRQHTIARIIEAAAPITAMFRPEAAAAEIAGIEVGPLIIAKIIYSPTATRLFVNGVNLSATNAGMAAVNITRAIDIAMRANMKQKVNIDTSQLRRTHDAQKNQVSSR